MDLTAYINDLPFGFLEGDSILTFVRKHLGSDSIPTLCHADNLESYGSCRICSVEISTTADGPRRVVASCHTPVTEGLRIYPSSDKILRLRRNILDLVLSEFPDGRVHPRPGLLPGEFQKVLVSAGIDKSRYAAVNLKQVPPPDTVHPYLRSDFSECIKCYRCVRACDELQGLHILAVRGRGNASSIIKGLDETFSESGCVSCGACVQTCPTNALSDIFGTKTMDADRIVRTVCTYCGVGCNLDVSVKNEKVSGIQAPVDAEVNRGHTCLKGRFAFGFYNHSDRLNSPMIRKNGILEEATWEEAYSYTARRFAEIRAESGPDSLAGISSARCTNEENYLMQKFFRVVIGTNNIDGCARVCHAPTAMGMQWGFGTGAATNSIDDLYSTSCILLIGSNATEAHPVTGARIKTLVQRGVPLIVIDPVKTDLARYAKYHLQNRPGTNVAILNLFAFYIYREGLADKNFIEGRTEGWEEFCGYLGSLDPVELERICGVDCELVRLAALEYASAYAAMEFHGLGVTEHWQGTKAITLILNIAMMTGNIGRKGTGINPLRGQNNVQGAADMGVQPHQGPGYLDVKDLRNNEIYSEFYGVTYPSGKGYRIPEMFGAATRGDLKALWIMGEDLLQTDPNTCHVKSALENIEFLVVQELFLTDTARIADVVFPASSFFEKEGTFTNGERRIQKVQRVVDPLAGTKPDGVIVTEMMNAMGYPQEEYSAGAVLAEISSIVPFFRGVSWNTLGKNGKQWPVSENGTGTSILHTERFNRGKGKFHIWNFEESPEIISNSEEFPYLLTTGRGLVHYNSGTMTRRTRNKELVKEDIVVISTADAFQQNIQEGDFVDIFSKRGQTSLRATISDKVKPGVIYTTFHFPESAINFLTGNIGDEYTLTPEYKVVAVNIKKSMFGRLSQSCL